MNELQIKVILSILPEEEVPVGLSPEFYRTLTYDGDLVLQGHYDSIRKQLKEQLKWTADHRGPDGYR